MTYETMITICVATGVSGLGFLLFQFREIIYYVERPAGEPGTIITEAVFMSLGLWAVYGLIVLFEPMTTLPTVIVAVGFAVMPWITLVRWLRWRYWNGGSDA